jgi:hypothetical protein
VTDLLFVPGSGELDIDAILESKLSEKDRHEGHYQVKVSRKARRKMMGLSKRGENSTKGRNIRRAKQRILRERREIDVVVNDCLDLRDDWLLIRGWLEDMARLYPFELQIEEHVDNGVLERQVICLIAPGDYEAMEPGDIKFLDAIGAIIV